MTVLDFPCLEFAVPVTEVTDLEVFVIPGPDVVDVVERFGDVVVIANDIFFVLDFP